jgi:hypothetical protein
MKNFWIKLLLSICLTAVLSMTDRFESIIQVYEGRGCDTFKTFPSSELPVTIKSDSEEFNNCYRKLNQAQIKLVDRENEGKILDELARQSTLPSRNIINIGEIITPQYIITEAISNNGKKIRMTSVSTGEVLWENSSKYGLFYSKINEVFILLSLISIYIVLTLLFLPYQRHVLKKKKKYEHQESFRNALKFIRKGNLKDGVDTLIDCAKSEECLETQLIANEKLKEIKETIGA